MGKVIVADENQGRRTLLASTLEREGFDVTRAGTLRQAEGTALAVMPEVVLLDGEWKSGDAIDAAQRLMGDPEFAFKCRIVLLSRSTTPDFMLVAAKAGIHEVIGKPVDMKVLGRPTLETQSQTIRSPSSRRHTRYGRGFVRCLAYGRWRRMGVTHAQGTGWTRPNQRVFHQRNSCSNGRRRNGR